MKKIYKVYEERTKVTRTWFNPWDIRDILDVKFYWTLEEAEKDYNSRTVAMAWYDDSCKLWSVEGKHLEEIEYDESEYDENVTLEEIESNSLFGRKGLKCDLSRFPVTEGDYKFATRFNSSGDIIEKFVTLAGAERAIAEYELEDRINGAYTDDFYEIITLEDDEN